MKRKSNNSALGGVSQLPLWQHEGKLILHVDVDAFFASIEQLLIPFLRGRAVVVGSGCIASCSYEARTFGLRSAMSLRDAKKLCPRAVILAGDYQIYRCFAERIWEITRRFTCGLETYLDEAYGDATGMCAIHGQPLKLGRTLQRQVRDEVGLPVSVGLAGNRMLAKIASSSAKPNGVAYVEPGREQEFLHALPASKLPGIGPKTARKLADMNVRTVGQLAKMDRSVLATIFGKRGEVIYERAMGRDTQALRPAGLSKTISRETTFHRATCDRGEIEGMLAYLLARAMRAMRELKLMTRCVELTIRYDDWKQSASRKSLDSPTQLDDRLLTIVLEMLARLHSRRVALRHVGLVLSNFSRAADGATLFTPQSEIDQGQLQRAIDEIRDKYGHASVVTGKSIDLLNKLEKNDYGFVLRTPSLTK